MSTYMPKAGDITRQWYVIDAEGKTLGHVAAKAADVTLIEVRIGYAIGGKGFVTLTGDVGAVRAAVSAAKENAELLVNTSIIPRPANQLFDALL